MSFDIGSLTDVGHRRSGNEDALDVLPLAGGDGTLCVVADGMGGHQAGEVASRLAVETIRRTFEGDQTFEALLQAIQAANRAIVEQAAADAAKRGMGTTLVCALLRGGRAQLANVGDSPAYLIRGERAQPLTQDHSWVAEEVARGAIQPDEAAAHPYRHVLTRCLGMDEQVEVQTYEPLDLQPGDVLVLCSDGLSEHVRPEELPPLVLGRSAEAAAEALVALANERGGSDNITVVVARYEQPVADDQQATLRLPNPLASADS